MRRFVNRHPEIEPLVGLPLIGFVIIVAPPAVLFVLALVIAAVVGYATGVAQPHGPVERLVVSWARVGICVMVAVFSLGWPPYRVVESEGWHWYAVLAVQLAAVLSLIAGTVRRRSAQSQPQRDAFSLGEYLLIVAGVVVMHWVMATVASDGTSLAGAVGDWSRSQDATSRAHAGYELYLGVIGWVAAFTYSQVTTWLAVRSLNTALVSDWRLPTSAALSQRDGAFVLAAVPVVLCLLPSASVGALLAGVIARLVLLVAVWAFTDDSPNAGWGSLRRALREKRARARRASGQAPAVS